MIKGITEKSNKGLFENEIEFNGKYATYARFLRDDVGIFATFRETYIVSAIIGYLNNVRESNDDTDKVQSASIFPTEIDKRKHDLKFLYRLLLLTKDEEGFSAEDYKDRAFRDDIEEHADQLRSNMDLFNSYVCGGVELLYEKFKDCDDEDKIALTLYNLIREFAEDIGLEEGELPDFTPEYR